MQAASREALVICREQLETASQGVAQDGLLALGDELVAVSRLLHTEAVLRRALSDPSRSEQDRVGLAEAVLGGHVGRKTLDVLRAVVAARWSTPSDLIDACELLGVQAFLIAAEREEALAEVEDELFRFGRIAEANPALGAALGDASATPERRDELVDMLLAEKARPVTIRLVHLSIEGFGGRGFEASLNRLVELTASRRGRSLVRVRVATPITEEQQERLAEILTDAYHRRMSLQVEVDKALIGGATVQIGDDLYDGSIARRLAEARRQLTNS